MTKRPAGALPEKERQRLHEEYALKKSPPGYYCVETAGGRFRKGDLAFSFDPSRAYYFNNFWFAYAYARQLGQEVKL